MIDVLLFSPTFLPRCSKTADNAAGAWSSRDSPQNRLPWSEEKSETEGHFFTPVNHDTRLDITFCRRWFPGRKKWQQKKRQTVSQRGSVDWKYQNSPLLCLINSRDRHICLVPPHLPLRQQPTRQEQRIWTSPHIFLIKGLELKNNHVTSRERFREVWS